jgi:hypothetical protein
MLNKWVVVPERGRALDILLIMLLPSGCGKFNHHQETGLVGCETKNHEYGKERHTPRNFYFIAVAVLMADIFTP